MADVDGIPGSSDHLMYIWEDSEMRSTLLESPIVMGFIGNDAKWASILFSELTMG